MNDPNPLTRIDTAPLEAALDELLRRIVEEHPDGALIIEERGADRITFRWIADERLGHVVLAARSATYPDGAFIPLASFMVRPGEPWPVEFTRWPRVEGPLQ